MTTSSKNQRSHEIVCSCGRRLRPSAARADRSPRCRDCRRRSGRSSSSSRPAAGRRSLLLLGLAVGTLALVLAAAAIALAGGGSTTPPAAVGPPVASPAGPGVEDLVAAYRFEAAADRSTGVEAEELRRLGATRDLLVRRLEELAAFGERRTFDLPGRRSVVLAGADRRVLRVEDGGDVVAIAWSDLDPATVLALMRVAGLEAEAFGGVVAFADRFALPRPAAPVVPVEPAAPRPVPAAAPAPAPEAVEEARQLPAAGGAPPPAIDDRAVERELAREAFAGRMAALERLGRAYRFAEAQASAGAYARELDGLGLADLADRVEAVAVRSAGGARLVARLRAAGQVEVGEALPIGRSSFDVARARAADDGLSIEFASGGSMEVRWSAAPTLLVTGLIGHLPLAVEDRLLLADLLIDRGHAEQALVELARCRRRGAGAGVDSLVAAARGVEVPDGGFVLDAEHGFVAPLEKELFDLGLVRWQDQWVTVADLERLRAGYALEGGAWMPREHLEALRASDRPGADGFVKVGGRWTYKYQKTIDGQLYYSFEGRYLPADRVRELRSQWSTPWVVATDEFVLRTDVSERLLPEILGALEAAWPVYAARYGQRPAAPLEYYAFADFDDFQAYCEANDLLEDMAGAQGFVDHRNDRAVAYLGRSADFFLRTSIHELAHLYYGQAFPSSFLPSWFGEGEATWFEGVDRDGDRYDFHGQPSSAVGELALAARRGDLPEMSVILQNTSSSSIGGGYGSIWYSGAWSLVAFLDSLAADDPVHEVWVDYRRQVAEGRIRHYRGQVRPLGQSPLEDLLRASGVDPAAVEGRWRRWIEARADRWVSTRNRPLVDDAIDGRGPAAAVEVADEPVGEGRIPFRGQGRTLEEIQAILAASASAAADPGDAGQDLVRRRTRANTHLFEDEGVAVSLPDNPAWKVLPLGASPFDLGRGVCRITRGDRVTVDVVAVDSDGAWTWRSQRVEGDDPSGLAAFLSVYVEGEEGDGRTDMGRFRRDRWVRRLVEFEGGRRQLTAVCLDRTGRRTIVAVARFAPGAHGDLALAVDSILDALRTSK